MSKNAIWKNFDHTYGPLPVKASEYLRLKQDIEKMEYNAKQKKAFDELTGDEHASSKSTFIKQKQYKLQLLETELCNNRYLYRSMDHMATVMQYIFPQYVVKEETPKTPSPEPMRAAMPAPVEVKPAPAKVYNDAWY